MLWKSKKSYKLIIKNSKQKKKRPLMRILLKILSRNHLWKVKIIKLKQWIPKMKV